MSCNGHWNGWWTRGLKKEAIFRDGGLLFSSSRFLMSRSAAQQFSRCQNCLKSSNLESYQLSSFLLRDLLRLQP